MIRLQKILSEAGIASRRAAERLIVERRVSVNGHIVDELGSKADPDSDDIRVDGKPVKAPQRKRYFLMNKPRGYVTTRSDPEGRPIVLDLLKRVREYVYPVGRLDYDSEGLLILTNDGELAARLTHPRHGIERVYEARVKGEVSDETVERLERGISIEGRRTAPARVRLVGGTSAKASRATNSILLVEIREGRNRQVRRMCEEVGHPVLRLRRIRIGPIHDPQLKSGAYRELTPAEIAALQKAAGATPAAPKRARRPKADET